MKFIINTILLMTTFFIVSGCDIEDTAIKKNSLSMISVEKSSLTVEEFVWMDDYPHVAVVNNMTNPDSPTTQYFVPSQTDDTQMNSVIDKIILDGVKIPKDVNATEVSSVILHTSLFLWFDGSAPKLEVFSNQESHTTLRENQTVPVELNENVYGTVNLTIEPEDFSAEDLYVTVIDKATNVVLPLRKLLHENNDPFITFDGEFNTILLSSIPINRELELMFIKGESPISRTETVSFTSDDSVFQLAQGSSNKDITVNFVD